MSVALDLTSTQLGVLLQQIGTTRDTGVLRKSLAWVEMYRGTPLWKISAHLQVSVRSLRRWREELLNRQASAVSIGLPDFEVHAGGRPNRWDEELDELLVAALSHRPDQLGYASASWSASLIQAHLRRWAGETFSCAWIRHRLHALGYVWKRPRYVLRPDPQRARKMAEISRNLGQLGPREVVLFEDETDLLLFPPLRSTWAPRGARIPVLLTGWNEKRVVFGAVNIHSGHALFRVREHNQAQDFVSFLRAVRAHYRGWRISMVLDEHPCHRAEASRIYAHRAGIKLIWLPGCKISLMGAG